VRAEFGDWTCAEVARRLKLRGSKQVNTQAIRRFFRKLKIDRQRTPRGQVYATDSDLKTKAPELYAKVVNS